MRVRVDQPIVIFEKQLKTDVEQYNPLIRPQQTTLRAAAGESCRDNSARRRPWESSAIPGFPHNVGPEVVGDARLEIWTDHPSAGRLEGGMSIIKSGSEYERGSHRLSAASTSVGFDVSIGSRDP